VVPVPILRDLKMDPQTAIPVNPSDKGLPSADTFAEIVTDETSSNWRTYKDPDTGRVYTYDPNTAWVTYNRATGEYEATIRESSSNPLGGPDPREAWGLIVDGVCGTFVGI